MSTTHSGFEIAPPRGLLGRARRSVVLLGAAVGDAVNFTAALGVLATTLGIWELRFAVGALTLATVGLMHFAGVSARKRRLAGLGWVAVGPVVTLGVLWLALGLTAFALRLAVPEDAGLGTQALTGTASAPAAPGGPDVTQVCLALLMLALFLATGGLAAWASYNGHDPEHDRLVGLRRARRWYRLRARVAARRAARQQRRELRRERRQARRGNGVLRRLLRTLLRAVQRRHAAVTTRSDQRAGRRKLRALERAEQQAHQAWVQATGAHAELVDRPGQLDKRIALVDAHHQAAVEASNAWADELRDYARLRLAAALADPATTTALTAPHLPRPAVAREAA